MRQNGDGQEDGGKSRRGHEQRREGRGQSFYHALHIGHSEAMRNMWQAVKVSVGTALCFWERPPLPQLSLVVHDNSPVFQCPQYELGPGAL